MAGGEGPGAGAARLTPSPDRRSDSAPEHPTALAVDHPAAGARERGGQEESETRVRVQGRRWRIGGGDKRAWVGLKGGGGLPYRIHTRNPPPITGQSKTQKKKHIPFI